MDRTETFAGDSGGTGDDVPPPATVGRYALRGRIGRGGFADVYRAWDERLERWLAVKVPRQDRRTDREAVAAWLAEARAIARVDHPHVVPIFDVGNEGDDLSYIVCKFVEGSDLKRLLLDRRFEWREAVRLCATVADALSHIHAKGLVHRDVKPGNILVADDGHVWLTDFGLALWEDRIGDRAFAYAGTLGFMSPEQARGEGHLVDGRTDVFSLGVVLYRMVTGHLPFSGQTDGQLRANLASRDAPPLRQWNPQVPPALERICLKALSKRASDRYSAASEFRDELLALLAEGNEPPVAVEPRSVPVEREPNAPVRPRGLRPYQEGDREFFLRLIEGPRDRHGTPQAIRDWIAAIAEDSPDPCFPVGVAYGPSGSGKTSLFRAGIVPLLPPRVVTLFADASTERLSATLVRRLRHQFPEESLPDDLAGALRTLRLRVGEEQGRKLLIVLDQFEQRLHGGEAERSSLIEALRQCDGVNVQAILIVRDDFWMPLTRFLHELDVRLVEGTNAFAVDLFSTRHAQRVLEELGRAYGSLPAIPAPLNAGQRRCLEEIVATVQERDRVVPIRLAIVAQMLREKPWNEGAIGRIGGAEGVVGAFLERAFESPNAPPARRRLASAARKVLAELLPSDEVAIKDRAKSETTLRNRAGLSNEDFEELLRTLDKELRVLTLAGEETEESRASVPADSERQYRLTHDYLIRPLRNWLNRKRRETFRGRTRLRLEELASLWASHPEARFLPTAWEFAAIELLVPDVERTEQERRLLETTRTRLRGVALRWGFLIAALCVIGFVGYRIYGERRSAAEMRDLVERLATAQIQNVPGVMEELDLRGERALAALAVVADDAEQPNPVRVRAAAALLPFDATYGETVARALADAESTAEFAMLRERWRRADAQTARTLTVLSRSPELPPQSRLRASAAILANPPPGQSDWSEAAPGIARALVDAPAHELPFWVETFRPLRATLRPEVSRLFSEERAREVRLNAAAVLADWGDDTQSVVRAVLEADASSFRVLMPALARRRDEALPALLERTQAPAQAETQLPVRLPELLEQELEDAQGFASDGFAFCQSLPRERFADVASRLKALGYRPVIVRPWTSSEGSGIAAVWKREAGEWRLRESMTQEEAIAEDSQARAAGLVAYDLAVEQSGEGPRWTMLWGTPPEGVSSSAIYVDVAEADHQRHWQPLNDAESVPRTNLRTVGEEGARYSSIRWQVDGIVAYVDRWTASDEEIASNGHTGWALVDVRVYGGSECGAIWWDGVDVDWKLVSATDLNEHRELCRAVAEAGYVPVSLSAREESPIRAASVWHKRRPTADELDEQAARRTNAALAAIELGAFADVRPLLVAGEDNRVRTEIVARLADFGVDPERVRVLLEAERNASVLSALLMAAAGYEPEALSTEVQEGMTSLAVGYGGHPAAGVRSAALCLLRRWERQSETKLAVESSPRSAEDRSDCEWYRGPEGFDFVVVEGPSVFSMGSRGDDPDRSASMETIHVRNVPRTFAIATTEVTTAQYRRFDPAHRPPSAYATDENCPAAMISLFDAMAYCLWLSEQAGVPEGEMCYPPRDRIGLGMTLPDDLLERTGYRLPTEAEWELACRAGSQTSRHYGSRASLLPLFGWDADNSDYRTHPVGGLLPNDLGLFDMYGNAMERTHSPWTPYPRSISETVVDRFEGHVVDSSDVFVVRGGAVLYAPSNGRSAQRHRNAAATRSPDLGFRVVRTVTVQTR